MIDVNEEMLALAQRQLGAKTKRDTINRALRIAAGLGVDDRADDLAWLQQNAADVLDFDVLEEQERDRTRAAVEAVASVGAEGGELSAAFLGDLQDAVAGCLGDDELMRRAIVRHKHG